MEKKSGLFCTGFAVAALLIGPSEILGVEGSIQIRKGKKPALHEMARITILKAIDIATARFEGTALEAELETEDGYLVYEVGVSTADGVVMEIVIDAGNGSILKTEQEEDEEEVLLGKSAKISLKDALKAAIAAWPGTAVEAELERKKGHLIYNVEIVNTDQKTSEVEVDASTGEIVKRAQD